MKNKITILTINNEKLTFDFSNIKNTQVLNECMNKLKSGEDIKENDFLGGYFGELKNYKVLEVIK
jgi:hypothetical protein